ncbi:MAG: sensor histidine kinase [Gorillibacterium sp.]|nr:sensor histidine kinase [Gorillibacterium sp.]
MKAHKPSLEERKARAPMRSRMVKLLPKSLKNRLIALFLLFILLPLVGLSVYIFNSVEVVLQSKANEQDRDLLYSFKQRLEDQSGILVKTWTLMDQDPGLEDLLKNPENYEWSDLRDKIEGKFYSISNSFFLTGSQVFYTLLDRKGNIYTSFYPDKAIQYEQQLQEPGFQKVIKSGERYLWVTNDANYVKRDLSRSSNMVSLYATLKGKYETPYAWLRISLDYEEWFQRAIQSLDGGKGETLYVLADGNGNTVLSSNTDKRLPQGALLKALATGEDRSVANWRDKQDDMLYTAAYIPSLDWYVVKGTPLKQLFAEVNEIKARFFGALAGFMLLVISLTVVLSSGITRPLLRLQRKMEIVAGSDLKAALPETNSSEEVQSLTRSFNRMVKDIHDLINRLKLEERQKQAIRFQVLLSQMNPHFLLNTLNTVKSMAMQRDQDEIHDIIVSLGKLLESNLNLDVDLIHLKDELGLVSAYLQIQNSRFGNRFEAEYDMEPSLHYALVPKSSLQPLVENAIVHGFGHAAKSGNIHIHAYPEGGLLIIEVADDGIGLEAAGSKPKRRANAGVGLSNLRERLGLLYQGNAKLTLESLATGTRARLELPLLLAPPYQKEEQHENGATG